MRCTARCTTRMGMGCSCGAHGLVAMLALSEFKVRVMGLMIQDTKLERKGRR